MRKSDNHDASGIIGDPLGEFDTRFTELEPLSVSGYNRVYKAKRFGRYWILKGLTPEAVSQPMYRTMLRKEFDIMSHLHHPSVVLATALETVDGVGECIVMEYIGGTTLNEWLDQKPSRRRRRYVADRIIDALEYVHSCGIVHRDVKPANIMVSRTGDNVTLIDFGLSDSDSYDILKQPAGTPRYLSPEQASGAELDVRNDIYSLGCVLKEMSAGRDYDSVAEKCLLPMNRRYLSVNDLKEALSNRRTRGRRLIVFSLIVAALFLIIGAVLSLSRVQRMTHENVMTIDTLRVRLNEAKMLNARMAEEVLSMQNSLETGDSARRLLQRNVSSLKDTLARHDKIVKGGQEKNLRIQKATRDARQFMRNEWGRRQRGIATGDSAAYIGKMTMALSSVWGETEKYVERIPGLTDSERNEVLSLAGREYREIYKEWQAKKQTFY